VSTIVQTAIDSAAALSLPLQCTSNDTYEPNNSATEAYDLGTLSLGTSEVEGILCFNNGPVPVTVDTTDWFEYDAPSAAACYDLTVVNDGMNDIDVEIVWLNGMSVDSGTASSGASLSLTNQSVSMLGHRVRLSGPWTSVAQDRSYTVTIAMKPATNCP
jgi:hypothetical protein